MSKLIIVESPTKARTLTSFLGEGYEVMASYGHLRDLPKKKIAIDFEHDFKPEYVTEDPDKIERVKALRQQAKKADQIILATDPDREGEAIAWHVSQILDGGGWKMEDGLRKVEHKKKETENGNLERIVFHEITKSAIEEALENPREIDMKLVDAQQARRILDRIYGYKLSPLLWRKVRRGLSAGRVQSVAVRLIVEREREIEKFVAKEYWTIKAVFDKNGKTFWANLIAEGDKKVEIANGDEATGIVNELIGLDYKVNDISIKETKRFSYPPFTTSTLQQTAANRFYWTAKRTMQVAQTLYEEGLITYMRTDSVNLSKEAIDKTRELIKGRFGQNYVPIAAKIYKTKSKVAQEAHEAIRPTEIWREVSEVEERLGKDAARLYELIWQRMMASQMTEAVFEETRVDITGKKWEVGSEELEREMGSGNEKYVLRANGTRRIFDGWQKVYDGTNGSNETNGIQEEQEQNVLPVLEINENLFLVEPKEKAIIPTQHFTQPLPRYNEASLIKTLEEYGIGRPSTYAPIISTILERQYVEKMDRKFKPTLLGVAVNDFLMTNFADLLDYKFTAGLENELDEIANGEKEWVPVIREFYDPFNKKLEEVGETAARVKVEVEETDEICPEDGGKLVVRIGKFGKFLACANFPTCKFTKPYVFKIGVKCPTCHEGDVILRKSKSKKTFYGCSKYPECNWASWTKPKTETVLSEDVRS